MTLAPLLDAGPVVISHAAAAFAALALGIAQLAAPKGTPAHRAVGWIWVALMGVVAAGSFAIQRTRHFSLIHLLSAFTLVMLVVGVLHARAGRIEAHKWTMISLFVFALAITGLFTLWPGRIMHKVVFGG